MFRCECIECVESKWVLKLKDIKKIKIGWKGKRKKNKEIGEGEEKWDMKE